MVSTDPRGNISISKCLNYLSMRDFSKKSNNPIYNSNTVIDVLNINNKDNRIPNKAGIDYLNSTSRNNQDNRDMSALSQYNYNITNDTSILLPLANNIATKNAAIQLLQKKYRIRTRGRSCARLEPIFYGKSLFCRFNKKCPSD